MMVALLLALASVAPAGAASAEGSVATQMPVARLQAPRIDLDTLVMASPAQSAVAFGPAHDHATPRPGRPGLSVVTGHADMHFPRIGELQPGDVIAVTVPTGQVLDYRVIGALFVNPDDAWNPPPSDRPRIALVSTSPSDAMLPDVRLHYVVFAETDSASPLPLARR